MIPSRMCKAGAIMTDKFDTELASITAAMMFGRRQFIGNAPLAGPI
jgi:hypothetical protein